MMPRNPRHINWNHQMMEQASERIRQLKAERDELLAKLKEARAMLWNCGYRGAACGLDRTIAKAESEAD